MISIIPPGKDPKEIACIGESQGYLPLFVHYGKFFDLAYERQTPQLTTAYVPTPEELAILNEGGAVEISLINITQQPPIMVSAVPIT